MPPNNKNSSKKKIVTLSDFSAAVGSHDGSSSRSPSVRPSAVRDSSKSERNGGDGPHLNNNSNDYPFQVCHIPHLSNAQQAKDLLHRVVQEFQPIIERRKYNIQSISELCCCNDGLDFEVTASGGKRRKRRKMSNNILGYNQTCRHRSGYKYHTIHLRLRQPSDQDRLYLYEDVAGTLAHELAHCVYGPHNDKFYKLMDEILDEHAALLATGLRRAGGGAPMAAFTGKGQKLGSAAAAAAAANPSFQGQGRTLGGGGGNQLPAGRALGGDSLFSNWMTPAEAAVAAAEARRRQQQMRLRGDRCCRPCTIEIDDDSSCSEEDDEEPAPSKAARKKPELDGGAAGSKRRTEDTENTKPVANKRPSSSSDHVIDLTEDDEDDRKPAAAAAVIASNTTTTNKIPEWSCHKCTYHNLPHALSCSMCCTERNSFRFSE